MPNPDRGPKPLNSDRAVIQLIAIFGLLYAVLITGALLPPELEKIQ